MPYVVLKPIPLGESNSIPAGAVVDAETWRNRRTLENGRYIQFIGSLTGKDAKATEKKSSIAEAQPAEVVESDKPKAEEPKKRVGRPPKVAARKE